MGGDPIILPHPLDLPGKGLAAYNAPASLVSDFLEACKNRRIDARHIPLSRLDAFRLPIEEETPLTVIHQDLPRDAFFAQAGRAANLLVYPLWFRRQRVCFFSRLDKSEHLHKPITAHDIHHNLAAVTRFLHAEQIVRLLDRANPANPNRAAAVPPTPLIPLDPYLDENQARAAGHIRGPI
ncbi:MAG: hypothetical protein ACE5GO_06445, partial [Anaerolineales bacterium]